MHTNKKFSALLVALTMAALLSGCNSRVTVTSTTDTEGMTKVATITIFGHTICLYDTDGDGEPDLARDDESGHTLPVEIDKRRNDEALTPGNERITSAGLHDLWSDMPHLPHLPHMVLDDSAGFDPPEPFDFGRLDSAAWHAQLGLDMEPGMEVVLENIDLIDFDLRSSEADAWFLWSDRLGFPRLDRQNVQYAIYTLPGETDDDPIFAAIHVAGPVTELLPLAAELNISEITFEGDGSTWLIEIESTTALATVWRDGAIETTIEF